MRHPILHLVVSARPNLPKIAAIWRALHAPGAASFCTPRILHTGQHHDRDMFGQHLDDLGLPPPHLALHAAGGSHAETCARIMTACEATWQRERPALAIVVGDVDGTLAAAIAARQMRIPVAHLEAGLRGGDWNMAEEINRRAVDAISDALWASTQEDAEGLVAAGHPPWRIRAVGNAMADTLLHNIDRARARPLPSGLRGGGYGVVTLHRAENVDDEPRLRAWLAVIGEAARQLPLAWPLHPRLRLRMETLGLALPAGVMPLPPLSYLNFLALLASSQLVASDSGGVQEEATILDIPCLTLRDSTERPLTLALGSSRLLEPHALCDALAEVAQGRWPHAAPIPLWDLQVGERVRDHLRELLG